MNSASAFCMYQPVKDWIPNLLLTLNVSVFQTCLKGEKTQGLYTSIKTKNKTPTLILERGKSIKPDKMKLSTVTTTEKI